MDKVKAMLRYRFDETIFWINSARDTVQTGMTSYSVCMCVCLRYRKGVTVWIVSV